MCFTNLLLQQIAITINTIFQTFMEIYTYQLQINHFSFTTHGFLFIHNYKKKLSTNKIIRKEFVSDYDNII